MIRAIFAFEILAFLIRVLHHTLGSKVDWLQFKDNLTWKRGFKRNKYEMFLKFEDNRVACYTLYANYAKYQAADLVTKLFEGNSFVGTEEDGRVRYYHSSQIVKIETQKIPLRCQKKGPF